MNVQLFQKIATQLLLTHYGLTLNDTRLGEADYVETLLAGESTRPFEYLNEIAEEFRLDRIDAGFDMGRALVAADEVTALMVLTGTQLLCDQPATCGLCGSRTSFDEIGGKQLHCCLGCGHEFVAEDDDEDDADREDGDD